MNNQQRPDGQTLDRLVSRKLHAKHTWVLRLPANGSLPGSSHDAFQRVREIVPAEQTVMGVTALGGSPITCTDLRAVAREAHARGEVIVCDNTLATSFGCPAARLGADIVCEELSHALGSEGSGYLAVSLSADFLTSHPEAGERLDPICEDFGHREDGRPGHAVSEEAPTLSILDAYLRWDTVRKRQNDAALAIAEYLVCHPKVARVWYPGLLRDQRDSSQPDPTNAAAPAILTGGFGPVVDFELANSSAHDCVPDFAAESHLRLIGKRLIRLVCTEEEIIAQARAVEQELAAI